MIIQIENKKLQAMLKIVYGGILKEKTHLLLTAVLIKTMNNRLFCVSINNDIEIVTHDVLTKHTADIEILVKYDLIYHICRTHNEDSIVTLKRNINSIEICVENTKFDAPLLNAVLFPSFKNTGIEVVKLKIKTDLLNVFMSRSLISLTEDNPKEFLTGVSICVNKNKLSIFSSDGIRLIYAYVLTENYNSYFNVVLPFSTVKEIVNTFNNNDYTYISISNSYIKLMSLKTILTTRVMRDIYHYPNIELSMNNCKIIKSSTKKFKEAVKKVSILCNKNSKINIIIDEKLLKIRTRSNYEYAFATLNSENEEKNISVVLDYKHLSDILKYIKSETFKIIVPINKNLAIIEDSEYNCIYIAVAFNI